MKKYYTVEPGRNIYHNGKPFISINREGETKPWEADDVTRAICVLLNKDEDVEIIYQTLKIQVALMHGEKQ